jgi:hypothetical protein
MALEQQNGLAVVHGIRNNGSAITITGYAQFILDSVKANHKFKLATVEDEIGFDRSLIATNSMVELDMAFVPAGATRDAAEDSVSDFLNPLDIIETANFKLAFLNAKWIYVGDQAIDLSHKEAKVTLKVRKYQDADQQASLSTPVSG